MRTIRLLAWALLAAAVSAGAALPAFGRPLRALQSDDTAAGNPDDYSRSGGIIEDSRGDRKTVMGSDYVPAGVRVARDAVTVMGSIRVDGEVGHDVKAVMGSATINGTVGHDVTAVMGSVTVGPHAVIRGNVTSVGGTVNLAPGAIVRGRVISQPYGGPWIGPGRIGRGVPSPEYWGDGFHGESFWNPWTHGINFVRGWIWGLRGCFLGFYVLLALAFPGGITRCGDQLAQRPGLVIAASCLGLLALPLVFLLLIVTVIGIPLAVLLLPLGVAAALVFGKASVLGLIGRNLLGRSTHPAAAVLVAGLIALALYFVPFLGALACVFLFILGFGCSLVALAPASRASPPAPPAPAPVPASVAPLAAVAAPVPPPPAPEAPPPAPAAPIPPPAPASALPRAGFWIRMGALFIDLVILGAVTDSLMWHERFVFLHGRLTFDNPALSLLTAIYGAILWKLRGTTIGGIVCGLRVVRLDDRPVDWETAIVRALGCFLSAAVLGLGFFWIGWDPEKQAWHDKIAGTVVVRTKGVPLV